MSMHRINNNHIAFKQCPSQSHLYVVDEEEKLHWIINANY